MPSCTIFRGRSAPLSPTRATGAHIINVHALGGLEMMRAAVEAAQTRAGELGITVPHVFAVTILTSHGAEDLADSGYKADPERMRRVSRRLRAMRDVRVSCAARMGCRSQEFLRLRFSHAHAGYSSGG